MDRARFDRFDVDKTGELEEPEVQAMMQEMGFECDAAYLNAMMRKFDTDGNGSVGFAEFKKMWKFITPVSTPRTAAKKGARPWLLHPPSCQRFGGGMADLCVW